MNKMHEFRIAFVVVYVKANDVLIAIISLWLVEHTEYTIKFVVNLSM